MEKYGKLYVKNHFKKGYDKYCDCICECGNEKVVGFYKLRSGHTTSCGCNKGRPIVDIIGNRYEKLSVIEFYGYDGKHTLWKCKCDCGNNIITRKNHLQNGHTKSCGCNKKFGYGYDERTKKRLLKHIKIENECWNWIGAKARHGYGASIYKGKLIPAHRLSYMIFKGEINDSKYVCHTCDNAKCINPDHLWLGTQKENMHDMIKKNRSNFCRA